MGEVTKRLFLADRGSCHPFVPGEGEEGGSMFEGGSSKLEFPLRPLRNLCISARNLSVVIYHSDNVLHLCIAQ